MATDTPLASQAVLDPPVGTPAGGLTRGSRATAARAGSTGETWPIRRAWLIVAAATGVALGLRLLLVRSIWVDEAISIHQAHMSLAGMLHDLRATDNHPPLYFLILWGTVRVLGSGQLAVHVPTIVAGTLLVPAVYLAGTELFGRRTGALAAVLTSMAPLLIWYAQEARPYAFFMLFATLAVWAQMRIFADGRNRYWMAYGALTIALLYTHYFSIIPIAIQQIAFAVVIWKRAASRDGRLGAAVRPVAPLITRYWITWVIIAIAIAPLVPYVHQQFSNDVLTGQGMAGAPSAGAVSAGAPQTGHPNLYALLANFVWAIWGYHANSTMLALGALWPLLMLLALALLGRGRSASVWLVVALSVLPALALMAIGFKDRTLFEVRYFSGAVPMLMLLCARAVLGASGRRLPVTALAVALTASLIAGAFDQQWARDNPRQYNFRAALQDVRRRAQPGDTLLYAPNYLADVIDYYAPGVRRQVISGPRPELPAHGKVFLLASFLDQPGVAPTVGAARYELQHSRLQLVHTYRLEKIFVWEYR
jgi:4-amino-4-deoxy-L-arabinose transferase-like glycosyltransferase